MSRCDVSPEEFDEILEEEWSPAIREALHQERERAAARQALRAKMTEKSRREALISAWQRETIRKLRQLHGYQLEVLAWRRRAAKPLWLGEAESRLSREMRGMNQRLAKAWREAAGGCPLQMRWVGDHAELIDAVTTASASAS